MNAITCTTRKQNILGILEDNKGGLTAEEIANEKPVYFLRCTKNDTAAEVMHHRITEDELAQEALK